MKRLAGLLYSLVMWALQPLLRRKLRRRGQKEPGYLHAIEERFGTYAQPSDAQGGYVWVHAVSLGETRAAGILLQALRTAQPDVRILLTHGTATGRAQGMSLLREGDVQVWQPWDTPAVVQRFLCRFKPSLGILLETEIWPNWVAQCQRLQVPLVLVNARMSEKSMRQAQRLSWLSGPAYEGLSVVLAQTQADAQRLQALGAHVKGVLGNLKFDAQPDPAQRAQAQAWKQPLNHPVVLLASSREGEEALWLDAIAACTQSTLSAGAGQPSPKQPVHWLLVPRHPQRFDDVAELITQRGWQVSRRSQWTAEPPTNMPHMPTIWLGDSLGEMALYYSLSDVALLGGSFAPLGGQNLIEATACGCPVVMGPHTYNFAQAAQLAEQAHAAVRVANMGEAVQVAVRMVGSEPVHQMHVQACAAFTQAHQGAAARTAQALRPYLTKR